MKLTGTQRLQLINTLMEAFDTLAKLTLMVSVRLNRNLQAIALGDDLQEIVFKLVKTAEAEGWLSRLIASARESNPGNSALFAFAQQLGLTSTTLSGPELEKVIKKTNSFLDLNMWRTRLGEIEAQVCCIEIMLDKGSEFDYGTGFLVKPDVVITNYHVMKAVIKDHRASPEDVILRFDYKRLDDGSVINPGTEYRLAEQDWLIYESPMASVDFMPEPKDGVPQTNQLDFVLLRLSEAPGSMPVGNKEEPGASLRKWIELPVQEYDFQPNTAMFIVQHPKGHPLKLTLDTEGIIGLNANHTRVTYRTNTLKGSSGSPCFNSNWRVVALHHSGEYNIEPTYNEGIPIAAIAALLKQQDLGWVLGEQKQ